MFRSARFHFLPRCSQLLPLRGYFHRTSRTAHFTRFSPSRCPVSNTCLEEFRECFCSWRSAHLRWVQPLCLCCICANRLSCTRHLDRCPVHRQIKSLLLCV